MESQSACHGGLVSAHLSNGNRTAVPMVTYIYREGTSWHGCSLSDFSRAVKISFASSTFSRGTHWGIPAMQVSGEGPHSGTSVSIAIPLDLRSLVESNMRIDVVGR